ncbi:MAG TPA: hypothetical protein VK763_11600 [Terriglobales bacterium]|nr:hypothetical protein [Terriglobales bacterium]
MVRINELNNSVRGCTVITQDGRLRREVIPIVGGRREMFEGSASDADVQRIKKDVTHPDFATAANRVNRQPGAMLSARDGRIVEVEVNPESEREVVLFVDAEGTKPTPSYLVDLVSFAKEAKDRKLPKLTGKVDSMCVSGSSR